MDHTIKEKNGFSIKSFKRLESKIFVLAFVVLSITYCKINAQDTVDASTLTGKVMCGYQGWFLAPGDGAGNSWFHWFNASAPTWANLNVDLFPDFSEYAPEELFATQMKYPNGSTVKLNSSYRETTQLRHFKWMKENDIDGVWVQRFGGHIGWNEFNNKNLLNCKKAAETHGRVFAVMYDVTGMNAGSLYTELTRDWSYLVDTFKVTASPRYLHHLGKPIVCIWGLGWTDRPLTADVARQLIKWFKTDAAPKYQATFMGGVRDSWRTMGAPWDSVFRSIDVISPWFVGSFNGLGGADNNKKNNLTPDIAEANKIGKDYLPVVWPGFSWANMHHGTTPQNQIPRLGGTFYWRQMYNCITAGATALYVAMFDEVDEGTAILKASPTKATAPADGYTLTLDADGYSLPSDWYLKLTGYGRKMLNKQIPLSSTIPTVGTIQEPLTRSPSAPQERMCAGRGVVMLSGLRNGKAEVVFYRLTGQMEKACTITTSSANGTAQLPVGVHSGAYLVQLKMDGKIVVSKVLYSF